MVGPLVYLNGRFLPQAEAQLPLHDAGFVLGATITDLCRTFRHRLFRLADHLVRFRCSCQSARISQPKSDGELTQIAEQLVAHNAALLEPRQDLALVLFATPGPVGYYLGQPGGAGDGPPTLGMHTFPLPFTRYVRLFQEGAGLVVASTRHVPARCVDPRVKQRSRIHWWLAEQEARQVEPGAIALLLDSDGYVTETAGANFLVVRNGTVVSPPRESILGGISLLTVEELCSELKIGFVEKPLDVYDCLSADEAMLASTPYCLAGVRRINDVPLPWPGPIFQQLLARWSQRVGMDPRAQIEATAEK
jgi:branched-chain amino acid aminotransferase